MSAFLSRAAGALVILVAAVVGTSRTESAAVADDTKPIRALLVIGGCCHDYKSQKDILTKGVSARANVQWAISYDKDTGIKHMNPVYASADWAKGFDVVVHDECCSDVKDSETVTRVLKPHKDGLPAVVLRTSSHSPRWLIASTAVICLGMPSHTTDDRRNTRRWSSDQCALSVPVQLLTSTTCGRPLASILSRESTCPSENAETSSMFGSSVGATQTTRELGARARDVSSAAAQQPSHLKDCTP